MTNVSKLAQLKLDVINYHATDKPSADGPVVNDRFLIGLGRDACYTSHNSLTFKKKQIADSLAEYDMAVEEKNTYSMERTERWINTLYPELEELEARHNADLEVYLQLTGGEVWTPNKRPAPSKAAKPANFNKLRERVA
jgi:hypothetical protein